MQNVNELCYISVMRFINVYMPSVPRISNINLIILQFS